MVDFRINNGYVAERYKVQESQRLEKQSDCSSSRLARGSSPERRRSVLWHGPECRRAISILGLRLLSGGPVCHGDAHTCTFSLCSSPMGEDPGSREK